MANRFTNETANTLLTTKSQWNRGLPYSQVDQKTTDDIAPQHRANWYVPCKHAIDFVLGLILILAALPVVLLAAVIVRLTSTGPGIYTQTRVGKAGRCYTMYKIRTMRHDCESKTGPRWAVAGDARVAPIGQFLRATHIDELPQLWNVLRREMSLVGPRPERPEFVAHLERALGRYRERLSVRPGITGLAQVYLPPDTDMESVRKKLAYDLYYIARLSPWLDVKLLLLTLSSNVGLPFDLARRLLRMPCGETIESAFHTLLHGSAAVGPQEAPRFVRECHQVVDSASVDPCLAPDATRKHDDSAPLAAIS